MKKIMLIIIILLISSSAHAMKYRVQSDVSFDNKQDAVNFVNYVESIKAKPVEVQTDTNNPTLTMPRECVMHECRHDEVPPQSCTNYESVDFKSTTQVWK